MARASRIEGNTRFTIDPTLNFHVGFVSASHVAVRFALLYNVGEDR